MNETGIARLPSTFAFAFLSFSNDAFHTTKLLFVNVSTIADKDQASEWACLVVVLDDVVNVYAYRGSAA